MKMTIEQALNYNQALGQTLSLKGDSVNRLKFFYTVNYNIGKLEPLIKAFQKDYTAPEGYSKFLNERKALIEKNAEKDENGKPITVGRPDGLTDYKMADIEQHTKEFEEMREKYQKDITEYEELIKEADKRVKDEVDIELRMLPLENIPVDISGHLMQTLQTLIEE